MGREHKWNMFPAQMGAGIATRQIHQREQPMQKPGSVSSSGQMLRLDTCPTEGVGREGGRSGPRGAGKTGRHRNPFGLLFLLPGCSCLNPAPVTSLTQSELGDWQTGLSWRPRKNGGSNSQAGPWSRQEVTGRTWGAIAGGGSRHTRIWKKEQCFGGRYSPLG